MSLKKSEDMTKDEAINLLVGNNTEKVTTHDIARAILALPEKTMNYDDPSDAYSESLVSTEDGDFLEVVIRSA